MIASQHCFSKIVSGLVACSVLLTTSAWSASNELADITANKTDTDLHLSVLGVGFDPVLHSETVDGTHVVTIEGFDVALSESLTTKKRFNEIENTLMRRFPAILKVEWLRSTIPDEAFMCRIYLNSAHQAHVKSNSGDRITIALVPSKEKAPLDRSSIPTTPVSQSHPPILTSPTLTLPETPKKPSAFSLYALSKNNTQPEWVRSAWDLHRKGSYQESIAKLTPHIHPDRITSNTNPYAVYLLAQNHLAQNNVAKSIPLLEALHKNQPDLLEPQLNLLRYHMAKKNWSKSRELANALKQAFPQNDTLVFYDAQINEKQGHVKEAQALYIELLTRDPNNSLYHERLAKTDLKTGNALGAIAELKQATYGDPENSSAWKILGFIEQKKKNPKLASLYYLKSLHPDVLINYASLLEKQNQHDEALSMLKAVEVVAANNLNVMFNVGMMYADMNEPLLATVTLSNFIDSVDNENDVRVKRATQKLTALKADYRPSTR